MAINKLKALHQYLVTQNFVDENKIESWSENGTMIETAKNNGYGYLICRFHYDAVINIERYSGDEDVLMVSLCVWLHDNDAPRYQDQLSSPSIDVDIVDHQCADVEIRLPFIEDINLVRDDNGKIQFNGDTWSIQNSEADIAASAGIGDSEDRDTDKPYRYGDEPK